MDKKEKKSFGYKVGYGIGTIVAICLATVFVALTARIVFWILSGLI